MTGLIGWWPLHEKSGSKAYDLSGNGNHGNLNGGLTQGVAGKGGLEAISFEGNSGYVNIGSMNDLISAGGSFSISRWIKPNTTANTMEGVTDYDGSNAGNDNSISVGVDDGTWAEGGIYLRAYRGEGSSSTQRYHISTGESVDPDKWYNITVTCDGSQIRLFVDGVQKASEAFDGMPNFQTDHDSENCAYFMGARNKGDGKSETYTDFTSGPMRVYNRSLSQSEIQTLYEWGNGDYVRPLNNDNSPSAVSRWAFDGNVDDSWGSYSSSDQTSTGYSNGVRGQSKRFNSSQGDFVSVNSGNSLSEDFTSTGITVSAWVNTSSTGARKTVWAGNGANAWWDTRVNENEKPEFWYSNSGQNSHITSPETVINSEWYHLAFVCRPSDYQMSIYMNGSRAASGGNGNTPNTKQFSKTSIGDRSGDEYMDGDIDDVRIYDKALSPSEVFELYRWGTRGRDLRKFTVNSR
ncbi:LamG domain-containing protein [Candidatus Nanosalina sp. VS9-1]|uniref:LamG domain-containing protein n=1 Tax=Candidatus Nanosalina sp. VS9-1 TaxID=3388566 RepID=UPI0039DFC763